LALVEQGTQVARAEEDPHRLGSFKEEVFAVAITLLYFKFSGNLSVAAKSAGGRNCCFDVTNHGSRHGAAFPLRGRTHQKSQRVVQDVGNPEAAGEPRREN
jgi:hypothetical protein